MIGENILFGGFMKFCRFAIFSFFLLLLLSIIGCGSASDDLAGSQIVVNTNVSLTGYIKDGSSNSIRANSKFRYVLSDLSGITVYLEDLPNLRGVTDSNGKYQILMYPKVAIILSQRRIKLAEYFSGQDKKIYLFLPQMVRQTLSFLKQIQLKFLK